MKSKFSILAILTACLLAHTARAQSVAYTVTATGASVADGVNFVLGSRFLLSADVFVTGLGWWDFGGDGLALDHPVAIWRTSDQAQLITGTVTSGVSGTLIGGFRYSPIASVLLPAGDYVIGGTSPTAGDNATANVPAINFVTDPLVTFIQDRQAGGSALIYPTVITGFQNGIFAGSFQFVSVPEPSTWALMAVCVIGAGCIFYWNIKKNKRALDVELQG